jgi:hypothetical protein
MANNKMTLNFLQVLTCLLMMYEFESDVIKNKDNIVVHDSAALFLIEGKLIIRSEFQPKPNIFTEIYVSLDYGRYSTFVRFFSF